VVRDVITGGECSSSVLADTIMKIPARHRMVVWRLVAEAQAVGQESSLLRE